MQKYGLFLAFMGAMILTPDAYFMRLSGLEGPQMVFWRGILSFVVYFSYWIVTRFHDYRRDIEWLLQPVFLGLVFCQMFNVAMFSIGISISTDVAPVLFGVATIPVFAAIFSGLFLKERTTFLTWVTIVIVLIGVFIALFDRGETASFDYFNVLGALAGLGVAIVLSMNFVLIRTAPDAPFVLAIALGALFSGGIAVFFVKDVWAHNGGHMWAIWVAGLIVLPISFLLLLNASKYISASSVSLMLLLETVLGPYWVWLGLGHAPSSQMILGGGIVVFTLLYFILFSQKKDEDTC